jgi:hypothetical protein
MDDSDSDFQAEDDDDKGEGPSIGVRKSNVQSRSKTSAKKSAGPPVVGGFFKCGSCDKQATYVSSLYLSQSYVSTVETGRLSNRFRLSHRPNTLPLTRTMTVSTSAISAPKLPVLPTTSSPPESDLQLRGRRLPREGLYGILLLLEPEPYEPSGRLLTSASPLFVVPQIVHYEEKKRIPTLIDTCIQIIATHVEDVESLGEDLGPKNLARVSIYPPIIFSSRYSC